MKFWNQIKVNKKKSKRNQEVDQAPMIRKRESIRKNTKNIKREGIIMFLQAQIVVMIVDQDLLLIEDQNMRIRNKRRKQEKVQSRTISNKRFD